MNFKQSLFSLAAIGMLLLVLMNLPPAAKARFAGGVKDALAPVAGVISRGLLFCRSVCTGGDDLAAHNRRLMIQLGQSRWEIQQLQFLEQENSELRRLLGLEARSRYRVVAAQVIDRSIGGWWQLARLDKGLVDGVTRDLAVLSEDGLVGRIVEVSTFTSDVLLLVDPNSKISARLSRMDAFGIVSGQGVSLRGDSLCRMDFIVKEANLQAGDEVVTSGLGGVYPPGLVIGYVEQDYLDNSSLDRHADIVPAADLRLLGFVFIVLREQPANPARERQP